MEFYSQHLLSICFLLFSFKWSMKVFSLTIQNTIKWKHQQRTLKNIAKKLITCEINEVPKKMSLFNVFLFAYYIVHLNLFNAILNEMVLNEVHSGQMFYFIYFLLWNLVFYLFNEMQVKLSQFISMISYAKNICHITCVLKFITHLYKLNDTIAAF